MTEFFDQMGNAVSLEHPPKRIVSLVPSQTELLFDLGLQDEVIGITKFCIHPREWFRSKERVGGTKKINIDKIHALQPDLIVANKEENVKDQIGELKKEFPVWVSDIKSLNDALEMINRVGELVKKQDKAVELVTGITREFGSLEVKRRQPQTVLYLLWRSPWLTAGGDTFINCMIEKAGFVNVFSDAKRYPEINAAMIKEKNPSLVFLSSEPYPFKEKHIPEIQSILPQSKIILVDGEMFSWYGSRLLKAPGYFQKIVNLHT